MNLMCFGSARFGMGLVASVDFVSMMLWFRAKRYLLASYKMVFGFEVAGVVVGAGFGFGLAGVVLGASFGFGVAGVVVGAGFGFGGEEMRVWNGRLGGVAATCAVSAIGFWLLIPNAASSCCTRKFKAAI